MKSHRRALISGLASGVLWPFQALGQSPQKQVLAFYYGWYEYPGRDGVYTHWLNHDPQARTIADSVDYPAGGPYDSRSADVIARHIALARESGLTGFICSWWGPNDRTDRQLPLMLDAAQSAGLSISAYIEQAETADDLVNDILSLSDRFSAHPAWLKLGARPVIFIFDRILQTLGLEGWKFARARITAVRPDIVFAGTANTLEEIAERRDVFDILHIYSIQFELADDHLLPYAWWQRRFYRRWIEAQAGMAVTTATITPAFDDRHLSDRKGRRPVVPRKNGETYMSLWDDVIRAKPDWVLIVSFNEWHEGSQIETSDQHADRELLTTQMKTKHFLMR